MHISVASQYDSLRYGCSRGEKEELSTFTLLLGVNTTSTLACLKFGEPLLVTQNLYGTEHPIWVRWGRLCAFISPSRLCGHSGRWDSLLSVRVWEGFGYGCMKVLLSSTWGAFNLALLNRLIKHYCYFHFIKGWTEALRFKMTNRYHLATRRSGNQI